MERKTVLTIAGILLVVLVATGRIPARPGLLLLVVFGALCYGLVLWDGRRLRPAPARPKPARPVADPRAEALRRIADMPIEEARVRAEGLLTEAGHWTARQDGDAPAAVERLAPGLRSLLTRYVRLSAPADAAWIDREAIEVFEWPAGTRLGFGVGAESRRGPYLRVGRDLDDSPIVVRPGDEALYVVHGPPSAPDSWWCGEHPSVYHWILVTDYRLAA
ncbi:MAG: hypothetical protein IT208_03405 [Chthonomonadales bacterium]|nr:hypothetical protein [Chthonomonadales bacterium]